ncbi:serine hydrolase domain-containing protein [Propionibacteriaceae bacterium Y1685]
MTSARDALLSGLPEGATPAWPGAVLRVRTAGQPPTYEVVGDAVRWQDATSELEPSERTAMSAELIFDLASVTKVFTAVIALRVAHDHQLSLDSPVGDVLAPYGEGTRAAVTVRHLLTHTAGLPASLFTHTLPADQRLGAVLSAPLVADPGSRFAYSCVGFQTLGLWAQAVTGSSLATLLGELITTPLGLHDTGYTPVANGVAVERVVPTEWQDEPPRHLVRGEVHDEAAWALGGVAGNAGIFSTAADLGRFADLLLAGGTLDGVEVLPAAVHDQLISPQLPEHLTEGYQYGLGVRIGQPSLTGPSPSAYGHGGFTGTALAVSPEHDATVVLLSHKVHPTRTHVGDIAEQRRAVIDAALG